MRNGADTVVTIELYGVPRLRAGTALVTVNAVTLADALDGLTRACPSLADAVVASGRVLPEYRLSLNGERFISDPATSLISGDVLLLLSADVGG